MAEEAKWYVVHTYSGYENKVKVDIEKTIENRGLQDQILEVSVPLEEVIELKNGAQKQVERKMFPGYVLIHMIMNDDTWYVVRNTRGVTGFVGPGSKPVPLEEEEMANLGIKQEDIVVDFEVGDTVTVLSGAWEGTVGMIQAIKGISFEVNQGEVIALIGANGAGKTTTLHTVTGLISPKSGQVLFEGKDITKTPAHKIVSMGMAHVPEGRRVFAELSVYENLRMGAYTRKDKAEIEETLKSVYKRFPRLQERKNQMAGTLSGGEQQMLAMGRALMSKPRIILMDEPSMGLSPIMVNEIFDIIRAVSESGTTVLLVEQNAKKALSIADRAYVLETGKIVLSGDAKELLEDDSIKKAYLGE